MVENGLKLYAGREERLDLKPQRTRDTTKPPHVASQGNQLHSPLQSTLPHKAKVLCNTKLKWRSSQQNNFGVFYPNLRYALVCCVLLCVRSAVCELRSEANAAPKDRAKLNLKGEPHPGRIVHRANSASKQSHSATKIATRSGFVTQSD